MDEKLLTCIDVKELKGFIDELYCQKEDAIVRAKRKLERASPKRKKEMMDVYEIAKDDLCKFTEFVRELDDHYGLYLRRRKWEVGKRINK